MGEGASIRPLFDPFSVLAGTLGIGDEWNTVLDPLGIHKKFDPLGFFGDDKPAELNSRGDAFSKADQKGLDNIKDPMAKVTAKMNWLTAGGSPKPIDPAVEFAKQAAMKPITDKAAAGAGIAGLFGLGKQLGGLNPSSPMAPGVAYSVPPLPKIPGVG